MNCRKVSRKLSVYIEDDLSPAEKLRIEQHLKDCSNCRRKAADLKLIVETASQLEHVEPGAYFVNRTLCAISQRRSPREILTSWRYRMTLSGVAFVVAASTTFFVIGPSATMVVQSPAGQTTIQAEMTPVIDSSTTPEKGFPVSDEALKRDMALSETPKSDSLNNEPETLPRQYVQPVSIKQKAKSDRVF